MNRTRRLIASGMIATLVLAGAACSDDDDDKSSDKVEQTTTTTEAAAADAPEPGDTIEVVGSDYAFEGLPDELAAGTYKVAFSNEGAEEHEIFIFANPKGLSLEEIMALGPEEGMKQVVPAMQMPAFASPGQAAPEAVEISLEEGEYVAVCFIPAKGDQQPHFAHGMQHEFTVV